MDFPEIVSKASRALLWWLPVILLVGLVKAPWLKEAIARRRRGAEVRLDPGIYLQAHQVDVPTPKGQARIEHVLLSRFGVFVVKTETAAGWILGEPGEAQWTRQLYRKSSRFENPLPQLERDTHALAAALGIPADDVHPVVTFVGDTVFKTEMPPNVTRGVGFVDYVTSFETPVFSENEVAKLAQRLQRGLSPPTLAARSPKAREHEQRSDAGTICSCPHCGGALPGTPGAPTSKPEPSATEIDRL